MDFQPCHTRMTREAYIAFRRAEDEALAQEMQALFIGQQPEGNPEVFSSLFTDYAQ